MLFQVSYSCWCTKYVNVIFFFSQSAGTQSNPRTCSLDCPPVGNGSSTRTLLTYSTLMGSTVPTSPVDNSAFLIPSNANSPSNYFSGAFQLIQGNSTNALQYIYNDT